MNGRGFFAKDNTLIELQSSHVRYVIDHSYVFEIPHKWVLDQYTVTGEKIGHEGRARQTVLKEVLSKGWVRIRETIGKDAKWTFQFSEFIKSKETIRIFITSAIADGDIKSHDRIVLSGIDDGYYRETYTEEIHKLFEEELK